ncbi:MAG: exo-alpha-sialidase [Lentisphaerae bacterium]|nr:exo-alpha-sialidase [Lentisphaerota bacterium]
MNRFNKFIIAGEGVIYRKKAGLQGYYARVVRLSAKEFVSSFVASTLQEGPDCHPVITRSLDAGKTWAVEGPVDRQRPARFPPTETGFISKDSDGSLMCLGARWKVNPASPDDSLINPTTVGMKENAVVSRRSRDGGRTWTEGRTIPKQLDCPFEVPTGMVALDDGTNMMSFGTWKKWDGSLPHGHSVRMVKSKDHCRTFWKLITIFHDTTDNLGFWEGRVVQAGGNRLLATCWAHDWKTDEDLLNHYAVSYDRGETWTEPKESMAEGQTGWPLWLGNDTFLFVYNHRRPPVGVKAQIVKLDGEKWVTLFDDMVWSPQSKAVGTISKGNYPVTSFQFGQPSAMSLDGNRIMVVYWCVVDKRAGINYTIIAI